MSRLARGEEATVKIDADAQFVDVTLTPGMPAAGQTVAEPGLARPAVIVLFRRGRDLVVPRRDAKLQVGEVVTALCGRESATAITTLLQSRGVSTP